MAGSYRHRVCAAVQASNDDKELRMPTKITVIYSNPTDPEAFETAYAAGQVELAKALPGLERIETSKVWPKEDGSPTPA